MPTENKANIIQKIKGLSRPKKIAFWSLVALVFYTIFGFLAAPPITKMVLEKQIPQLLHRQASIEKIRLNPFTLRIIIEGFKLSKKAGQGSFISFGLFDVNLQASSIIKRALVVKSVKLEGPTINFSRIDENTYSFTDLMKKEGPVEGEEKAAKPFLFSINNIEISGGNIQFDDQPKAKVHKIAKLSLAVPAISNLAIYIENQVQPSFSAIVNGTNFSLIGSSKPFKETRESVFGLKLTALQIPEYLAYIPNNTGLTIGSGQLDIDSQISFAATKDEAQLSLTGLVAISGLDVVDLKGKSYIKIPKLAVVFKESNLLKQQVKISKVEFSEPQVDIFKQADGVLLPFGLLTGPPSPQEKQTDDQKEEDALAVELSIDNIIMKEGGISFVDGSAPPFQTTVKPIDIDIKNFSTIPASKALFDIAMVTEKSEFLKLKGEVSNNPLAVSGTVGLQALALSKYQPYIDPLVAATVTGGLLDVQMAVHYFREGENSQAKLTDVRVDLQDFGVKGGKNEILALDQLTVSGSEVDVNERLVKVGKLESRGAQINIIKRGDGSMNISDMVKKSNDEKAAASIAGEKGDESGAWLINLHNGQLHDYAVNFADSSLKSPAINKLRIDQLLLGDISTKKDSRGNIELAATINEKGKVKAKGELGVLPFTTSLAVDLSKIELKPLQPYVGEKVKIVVAGGDVAVKGDLHLAQGKEFAADFAGEAGVDDLLVLDLEGSEMLKWQKFTFAGLDYQSQPQKLLINEVGLQEIYSKVSVGEDGSLNWANLQEPSSEPQENQEAPQENAADDEKIAIDIKSFKMQGGKLDFEDRKIKPVYAATLDNLTGKISGMSTKKDSLAEVDMSGKVNQQAPVKITGQINPLKDELFADLKVDFHDIDLSSTSPYTGKFIGYKTDKGKLTLNLHYNINGKELKAKNHAFLDQFTLGDAVDSPDAVTLPIQLALALLKNRSGEIYLDVPVQGNMDDPEFSVGGVIFRVIFNLIAKAATSPFALLGALIPDGEDLQFVEFAPGSNEISQAAADKLSKMASVLYDRPGLRMDIKGGISPQEDRKVLALKRLDRLVRLQKLKASGPAGKDKDPSIVEVTPEEYPKFLAKAYKAQKKQMAADPAAAKPAKEKKVNSPLTVEDMQAEMLAAIVINDDELRLLAIERANKVMDFLTKEGAIEGERLFLVEPKAAPGADAEAENSPPKVDFIIK